MSIEQPQLHKPEMKSVPAIEKSGGEMFRTRAQIKGFVETPLVEACELFWDLNILTWNSSANSNDLETGYAYIGLDRQSLSPENRAIAKRLCRIDEEENGVIYLHIPIEAGDTVEDVRQKSLQLARRFQKQPMTWTPTFTIRDLKTKVARIPAESPKFNDPKTWQEAGYYYDQASNLFYLSEEHFKKATEKI